MEAKEYKIIDILTENKKYIIPPYQRPYKWNKEQTDELLEDIMQSFRSDSSEYFIGTLICIDKSNNIFEVIDGQQRLTTLSLIFAKMKDLIKINTKAKGNLFERVLVSDDFGEAAKEARLKVRDLEYDLYYHYILQGNRKYLPNEPTFNEPTFTEKLYIDNSEYIESYLNEQLLGDEAKLCSLARYILNQVYVVFVRTDNLVSSFRLFNVLNTRGLPLGASDLIKNNLFEVAETNNISYEKIEKYWLEIENVISVENMDKFLRLNQTSRKRDRDRASKDLFTEYSEIIGDKTIGSPLDFVVDLLHSAKNYRKIKHLEYFSEIDNESKKTLSSLNRLGDEWLPAVLAFLNRIGEDSTINNPTYLKNFLSIFEKAYIQSWFLQQVKSKREAVIYSALVSINTQESIDMIIQSITKHANNRIFVKSLSYDLYEPYSGKVNFIKAVLLRIDQEIQDESVFKYYNDKISIEHILPQNNSNDYWQARFSEEEFKYWLHKLGNLTLLSGTKNTQASNEGFDKKKLVYNDPKKSLDITREVCEYKNWGPKEVEDRHQKLIQKAKSIWMI